MSSWDALIISPSQVLFIDIHRQVHIKKCAIKSFNMGNHHFTHNFHRYAKQEAIMSFVVC